MLWLSIQWTMGQGKQPCHCPATMYGTKMQRYDLADGKSLAVCGYREKNKKDTIYDGFVLFQCGRKEILDEEDETSSCKIAQLNDTLILSEFYILPIGKNFEMVSLPFRIHKFFSRPSKIADTTYFRSDLPKYSTARINTVLRQYAHLTGKDNDSVNLVAHWLFWAYVSGSSQAEKYLRGMKSKFGPFDGAIAEEFEETWATYELWKSTSNPPITRPSSRATPRTGEPLVGRNIVYYLYPIAQVELSATEDKLTTVRNLEQRLIYGSYPELWHLANQQEQENYLKQLVNSYLLKDILAMENVKGADVLFKLLQLLAWQLGRQVSTSELGSTLQLNKTTVDRYLDLLSKVFIIYPLNGYSNNLRKKVSKSKKWYFYDNGIRNALINNFRPLQSRNDIGQLWEQYIFRQLLQKPIRRPIFR
jgi:hypothetical protein